MIFVDQTVIGDKGNCMAACLASVLELPLEAVPDLWAKGGDVNWNADLRNWLETVGLGIVTISVTAEYLKTIKGPIIVSGLSDRGLRHSTVWFEGHMIHDPHQDRTGLQAPEEADILYPLALSLYVKVYSA